jgi:hypothetical protein
MEEMCKGLLERLGYNDLLWLDLDIFISQYIGQEEKS